MLKETGCDAVMIGRGVLGDPWLIKDIAHYLECGKHMPEVTLEETFAMARLHAKRLCNLKGEFVGIREMRGHAAWYVKGLPKSHQLKDQLSKIETYEEMQAYYPHMKQSMQEYRNSINRGTVEVVLHSRVDIAVLCYAIRFRRFFFLHCGMEESDLLSIYLSC